MLPVRLALAINDGKLRREVTQALAGLPARIVADCHEFAGWRGFLEQLAQEQPHVVLLDISRLPVPLDDAVGSVRLAAPAAVAALNTSADSESVLRAVRAGANDYLYPPLRFTLRKLIERKSQELRPAAAVRTRGRVLAFLSVKGGCGATTLACRVAAELARRGGANGQNALLVDLDQDAGIAGFLLNARTLFTVRDALHSIYRMSERHWQSLVANVADGLEMLPAPPLRVPREAFLGEQVRDMLEFARAHYDWTVVDLGRGWAGSGLDLLPYADENFLVFTPDLPALNHARHMVELLLREKLGEDKLRLVLNRAPRDLYPTVAEIESVMSMPVFAVVPETGPASTDDWLIPASALGRQLLELAARAAE